MVEISFDMVLHVSEDGLAGQIAFRGLQVACKAL